MFDFDHSLISYGDDERAGGGGICVPGLEQLYKDAMINGIGAETYAYLNEYRMFELPWRVEAAFDRDPTGEHFGPNSQYTHDVLLSHDRIQEFWHLGGVQTGRSNRYTLRSVRGSVLGDDDFTTALALVSLYDMTLDDAKDAVYNMRAVIEEHVPQGYDNPLFSFHAHFYQIGAESGAFMLGDGMLEYLDGLGRANDVPFGMALEAKMAHMHGQYLLHVELGFDGIPIDTAIVSATSRAGDSEGIKYRELLAASLAAYYVAHPKGGNYRGHDLCDIYIDLVRSAGNCDYNEGHSKTRNQIECAANWAAKLVLEDIKLEEAAMPRSPADIQDSFDKVFPDILTNYWETCSKMTVDECNMVVDKTDGETAVADNAFDMAVGREGDQRFGEDIDPSSAATPIGRRSTALRAWMMALTLPLLVYVLIGEL